MTNDNSMTEIMKNNLQINTENLDSLTPSRIVELLDKYIIGQDKAKKAVAIALRNRTRRKKLPKEIRDEIIPKNIIMIGPTGVGKTEIARRIAQLTGAPFIKVEATKYTEIGYVGRNVEQIIRDLMSSAVSTVIKEQMDLFREKVKDRVDSIILSKLMPTQDDPFTASDGKVEVVGSYTKNSSAAMEKMRELYNQGKFEDKIIEIEVKEQQNFSDMLNIPGMEDLGVSIGGIFPGIPPKKKKRRVKVSEARNILEEIELDKIVDKDLAVEIAKDRVENMGIVFIDEIDKIIGGRSDAGPDVSREGVQRDLLPIVEGTTVMTRYGPVNSDHILFIAAGAFSYYKPSDLIPELQGRFPIRVELNPLTAEDFKRILTEPKNAIIKQYIALLETEDVNISFTEDAIEALASISYEINSRTDNIGARRLHTVMEIVLEELLFNADKYSTQSIQIDRDYVNSKLCDIMEKKDLSKYIL
ncbi:MAG: ATP-dependent protease ATPase subunit HslU [Exilispira sp.]|nr:ATP-dependent protease ATPase subunit HslU [Exilispira sp.]